VTQRPDDPAWSAPPADASPDAERMAALLDDRLRGAERDALLARLADSEEELALFADAAAIQRELEAEDEAAAVPGVLPLRRPARPARGVDRRLVLLAAVLAGVTLLPLAWRAGQGGAVREPSQAVAMLENPAAGLPKDWVYTPAWSGTRGGQGDPLTDETLSVRMGAYMVNLELAVRARDAEQTRWVADRVASDLTNAGTSGTVVAGAFRRLSERAGASPAELLPVLEEAQDALDDAVDANRYALGAWAEAARLAAQRQDAAFFREARTRRTLARAEELVGDNPGAQAAIAKLRAALTSAGPDWTALGGATGQLLSAIG
jgi:hypothetical protein